MLFVCIWICGQVSDLRNWLFEAEVPDHLVVDRLIDKSTSVRLERCV